MIEHSALTTKVYEWLRDSILQHGFRPGDKLDVQQLAEQLGVSRTPVKDAINRLAIEGLVVLHSRQGTYVATLTPQTVRELFAVREMIERSVAENLSRETLIEHATVVADIYERCDQLLDVAIADQFKFSAFVPLDRRLHGLIVDLAANGVLSEIYQRVIVRMWIGRIYYADQEESFRRSQKSHAEHAAIVRAFAMGNAPALAAALRAHSQSSLGHTLGVLARYPQVPARERRTQRVTMIDSPAHSA